MFSSSRFLQFSRSRVAGAMLVITLAIAVLTRTAAPSGAAPVVEPLPLGVFQLLTTKPSCITGYTCRGFTVKTCSNVRADITGTIAKAYPPKTVPVRGLVVLFSGTAGKSWWNGGTGIGNTMLTDLRENHGLVTVQIRWDAQWFEASPGEDTGVAHEACRPATVVRWIYDSLYVPLGITAAPGVCGFCITGNSGGAAQVGYSLSHFGLENIVNAAVPTSGPTMSRIDKGCQPEYPEFNFETWSTVAMDRAFGFFDPGTDPGPCVRQDPTLVPRWLEESVLGGVADLSYPTVRIEVIIGGLDNTSAVSQAAEYEAAIQADPANHLTATFVPDMGHTIGKYQSGVDALEAALLGSL